MKKTILLSFLLLLCLVLSSCATLAVRCGIDEKNNAYLYITYQADISAFDDGNQAQIRDGLSKLARYYDDTLHYSVTTSGLDAESTDETVNLELELRRSGDSLDEALTNLEDMLTDEALSPFTTLELTHTEGEKELYCRFHGTIDAKQVIAASGISAFPQATAETLSEAFENSTCTITVTLPATEVLSSDGTVKQSGAFADVTVPVNLTEETSTDMNTRVRLLHGAPITAKTEHSLQIGMTVLKAVLILGIFLLIVLLFLRITKAAKQTKNDGDTPL